MGEIKMDKFVTNVSVEETEEYKTGELLEDKPQQGKIYSLFGGKNEPCIAAGNTWAESEVKES